MILTFIETENGLIKKSSLTAASYCYELKEKFKYAVIGVISNKIEETETKKLNDFGISKLYKVDNGCQNQFDSISRCSRYSTQFSSFDAIFEIWVVVLILVVLAVVLVLVISN